MTQINTSRELLEAALEDLRAGAEALVARLPAIAGHLSDDPLRATFTEIVDGARQDAERLRATGLADGGPENLWMAGILDDAERDTQATAPGGLLDTALIGAIRKGLASTIVSYDTGLALARATNEQKAVQAVGECQDAVVRLDHDLAGHLARIAGALG